MTRGPVPPGYTVDHHRTRIGAGAAAFAQAEAALREWRMFRLGWLSLIPPAAPIRPGVDVAVIARAFGMWSMNACRIVYLVDDPGPDRRFGFAYGTLADHAERGEERFTVEWRGADDSVWFEILAYSRPAHWLARLGHPFARALQRRFARDASAQMAGRFSPSPRLA